MSLKIERDTSTVAKGIFACFVVFYHICGPLSILEGSYLHAIFCRIGMFGFLFLSGYGCNCSYKEKGLSNFWDKKIETIYVPAFLSNIVGLLVCLLLDETMDRATVFENVVRFSPDSVFNKFLWYLHYLLFWYLCFWVVNRFVSRKYVHFIWILIMLAMWYIGPEVYVWGQANNYCLAFVTGIFYQEIVDLKNVTEWISKQRILKACIVILAIGGVILATQMDPVGVTIMGRRINFWIHTALYNVICFLGMMFIFLVCRWIEGLSIKPIFMWLGQISFMIYVLHNPLMYFPLEKCVNANKFLIAGIGFGLCLVIGTLYIYIIQPWLLCRNRLERK